MDRKQFFGQGAREVVPGSESTDFGAMYVGLAKSSAGLGRETYRSTASDVRHYLTKSPAFEATNSVVPAFEVRGLHFVQAGNVLLWRLDCNSKIIF